MSTIFEKFAESLEATQKTPSSNLHLPKTFDVVKPAVTTVTHTSEKEDLAALVEWLSTAPVGLLEITDITQEEAANLQDQLRQSGHKVRYDWHHSSRLAVFRMPTSLHNTPGTWLTLCLPKVEETIKASARCGDPFLHSHGDGRVVISTSSSFQPDGQIDMHIHFHQGPGAERYIVPQPRIVLETAFSQKVNDAQDKAVEYLYNGDHHTHAVIIVDMTYPVEPGKAFAARIAVWTRKETQVTDKDYPFEDSGRYQHESPIPTPPVTPTPPVDECKVDSPDSWESKTLTEASEATTRVDIVPPKPLKTHEKDIFGIGVQAIETPGYMVVLEELDGVILDQVPDRFDLVLDVFHFLRRCLQHPDRIPDPGEVLLPLAPLRDNIIAALASCREEANRRKRKLDTQDVAVPEDDTPATERSATPDKLRAWKRFKKSKRG